jgi:hypothetical protein
MESGQLHALAALTLRKETTYTRWLRAWFALTKLLKMANIVACQTLGEMSTPSRAEQ